jgi:hypothetical protein
MTTFGPLQMYGMWGRDKIELRKRAKGVEMRGEREEMLKAEGMREEG